MKPDWAYQQVINDIYNLFKVFLRLLQEKATSLPLKCLNLTDKHQETINYTCLKVEKGRYQELVVWKALVWPEP